MRKKILALLVCCCCATGVLLALPRFTLKHTDQQIFGTYVFYQQLREVFPGTGLKVAWKSPAEYLRSNYVTNTTYCIISPWVDCSGKDVEALESFVRNGNTLVISTYDLGPLLSQWLHVTITETYNNLYAKDYRKDSVSIYDGRDSSFHSFPMGRVLSDGYFTYTAGTNHFEYWGNNKLGKNNFIRISIGTGLVLLQCQPMLFTNFHLINKHTEDYSALFLSSLPDNTDIIWDEYFKSIHQKNSGSDSLQSLSFIMKHDALRMAFFWALFGLILLLLLAFKRRQRIIPETVPLTNSSLDMVRTISDLYYFSHRNEVMAQKKIAHWTEYMRNRYNIFAPRFSKGFWSTIRKRTPVSEKKFEELRSMVEHFADGQTSVTDIELIVLNRVIDEYYKV
jgi:hypothetical protein